MKKLTKCFSKEIGYKDDIAAMHGREGEWTVLTEIAATYYPEESKIRFITNMPRKNVKAIAGYKDAEFDTFCDSLSGDGWKEVSFAELQKIN